jgi:hypothetical protein
MFGMYLEAAKEMEVMARLSLSPPSQLSDMDLHDHMLQVRKCCSLMPNH